MTTGKSDEFFTMLGKTLSSCKDGERCGDIFFPKICKGFSTTFSCSEKKKKKARLITGIFQHTQSIVIGHFPSFLKEGSI